MRVERQVGEAFINRHNYETNKSIYREGILPKRLFYFKNKKDGYTLCDNSCWGCFCSYHKTEKAVLEHIEKWIVVDNEEITKPKIYISGPISGICNLNREAFSKAENYLKSLGFDPINPLGLLHKKASKWVDCMKKDIEELMKCSKIYMLKGYQNSKGALIELDLALNLGYDILFECPEIEKKKEDLIEFKMAKELTYGLLASNLKD